MEEKQCFLCRDDGVILYKICDCNDSTICIDCYNNEGTSKMDKCGICRKDYEFNYMRDYQSFLKILFAFLTKYSIILCIELFPPLYIYLIEDYSIQNNILLSISFFFITIGNIIIYNFIRLYIRTAEQYDNLMKLLTPIKMIYIISMFCVILLMYKNDKIIIYNYFVVVFIYILPLFIISFILLINKLTNFKKHINEESLTRQIKIKNIIESSRYEALQRTINNV
jgi:hypothetical protein